MPATTDTLEALTQVYGLAATDILHLMRDPDLPGRVDRKVSAAAFAFQIGGGSALADALYFDGVTPGTRMYFPMGASGNVATAPFSVVLPFFNDGIAKTGNRGMWALSSSATDAGLASGLTFSISSSDQLRGELFGSSPAYVRSLTKANISTTLSIGWHLLVVTWERLSAPIVYLDGAVQAMTETTAGASPPVWTDSIASAYCLVGIRTPTEIWSGWMLPVTLINAVLSPAEILALAHTGRLPTWCSSSTGSMLAKYSSDFSAGLDSWVAAPTGCTWTGNVDGINGQDDWASAQRTSTTGVLFGQRSLATAFAGIPVGLAFELRVRVFNGSATTRYFSCGFAGFIVDAGGGAAPVAVAAGTQADLVIVRHMREGEAPFTDFRIYAVTLANALDNTVPAGDIIYFKNIQVRVLAPTFKAGLQDGTYQAARDVGQNGIDGTASAGLSVFVDGKRRPQVRAKNVNVGTAAYLIQSADILLSGWDVDCIQITNNAGASAVDVKVQLSDGTNHTDLMTIATIAAGATSLFYPSVGGLDTRRRLRCVAASGATDLTFNFSLRKRA